MDTKQFIASLVSSLAWPAAVVCIVLLFRARLAQLLSDNLRRLKAGPVELEFERLISAAQAQIEEAIPAGTATDSIAADLAAVAHTAPTAAVIEAFARIEGKLRDLLRSAGDASADEKMGVMALVRQALDQNLITPETANAVEGLSVLRNLAAHGRTGEVSEERALDYITLVDALLYAMRQKPNG
jgi:hypothetical protein